MPALFSKKLIPGVLVVLSFSAGAQDAELRRAQSLVFNCFTCHGSDGKSPGTMKSLNTLPAAEIRDKLMAFKRNENDPTIMNRIARGYSDDEIAVIADYIADLE